MPPKKKYTKNEQKGLLKLKLLEEQMEKEKQTQEQLKENLLKEQRESKIRTFQLEATKKHFDLVYKKVQDHYSVVKKSNKWQNYLNPKSTPEPFSPPHIRQYLYKWEIEDDRRLKETFDPKLALDEGANGPALGDTVAERVREVSSIVDQIKSVLNDGEVKLEQRVINDLKYLQLLIRKLLRHYVDRWTLSVMSNIERDMEKIDPISAKYLYDSDIIKHHIWTFRDVPLPPNYRDVDQIEMKVINSVFNNSSIIDLRNYCIRGLHYSYDHFTDLAPTYSPRFPDFKHSLESLQQVVEYELALSEFLRKKKLAEMREEREFFATKHTQESTAQSSRKGAKSSPIKKKQHGSELSLIPDYTLVDVKEELSYEFETAVGRQREKLHPHSLNLKSEELNLREFSVLGGIFELNLLEKPRQAREYDGQVIVRLIDETNRTLKYLDFYYDYVELQAPRMSQVEPLKTHRQSIFSIKHVKPSPNETDHRRSHLFVQKSRKSELEDLKAKEMEQKWLNENQLNQRKLFEFKIQIPKHMYWWESPKVCRWMSRSEVEENYPQEHKVEIENVTQLFEAQEPMKDKKKFTRRQSMYKQRVTTPLLPIQSSGQSKTVETDEQSSEFNPKPSGDKDQSTQRILGTWSTKHIHLVEFDQEKSTVSFRAGKFGVFGLYVNRYTNLPFKSWRMEPIGGVNQGVPKVLISLELQHTKMDFKVGPSGVKCGIYMKTKTFLTELIPIVEDYVEVKKVKQILRRRNLDVFPEIDASHYVGGCREKLAVLEDHTFKALTAFCLTHSFSHNFWNRYASHRKILLKVDFLSSRSVRERDVLVTTRSASYVHTTQCCDDDKLFHAQNPPNQTFYADLFNLLLGGLPFSMKKTLTKTDPLLKWHLYELLHSLKIFSYSS